MRKPQFSILLLITLLFVCYTAGYFLGMNQRKSQLTVSVSKEISTKPEQIVLKDIPAEREIETVFPVSINHAQKDDLMALPGIGDVLAQRILDYRENHGQFTSAEELLNIEGIGEKRLEELLDYIVIGG